MKYFARTLLSAVVVTFIIAEVDNVVAADSDGPQPTFDENANRVITTATTKVATSTKLSPTTIKTSTKLPPTTIITSTKFPPTTIKTSTKLPPTTIKTSTKFPPTTIKTSTKLPPTTIITSTKFPPTTIITSTKFPPTTIITSTKFPPTTIKTSTKLPPTTIKTSTKLPPTTIKTSTKLPPTTIKTSTKLPPTTPATVKPTTSTSPLACSSRPCKNEGNCTDQPGGGYKCTCKPYYTGRNCETNVHHPCRSGPCVNGGKCIEVGNCTSLFKCVCAFGFTGTLCEVEVKEFVLNITARESLSALYLDGVQVFNLDNTQDWKKVATIRAPITTRLVAIIGANIHDICAGIIVSERNRFILSDNINWKCYIDATYGWSDLNYNDSHWPAAHIVASNGPVTACPGSDTVKDIHPNAKWIWTTHNIQYDLVVYCRGYIDICISKPCQNGGICHKSGNKLCTCLKGYTGNFCEKAEITNFTIFAYEKLELVYIDGIKMKSYPSKVNQFTLQPLTRQVAVMVTDVDQVSNVKKCYGLVASTNLGPVELMTSKSNWKCEHNPISGWHQNEHNDEMWHRPNELQYNNVSRCNDLQPIKEISGIAQWIWPEKSLERFLVAFCRATTNLCHKQLNICQNQGICNPNKGPICLCSKGFTGQFCEYKIGVDVPGPEDKCPSDS